MKVFTIEAHCPDIRSQADVMQAKSAMSSSPGFSKAEVDIGTHQVVATTANQDQGHALLHALAKAGFPAEEMHLVDDGERPG